VLCLAHHREANLRCFRPCPPDALPVACEGVADDTAHQRAYPNIPTLPLAVSSRRRARRRRPTAASRPREPARHQPSHLLPSSPSQQRKPPSSTLSRPLRPSLRPLVLRAPRLSPPSRQLLSPTLPARLGRPARHAWSEATFPATLSPPQLDRYLTSWRFLRCCPLRRRVLWA